MMAWRLLRGFTGGAGVATPDWYNVRSYGALGNGVTDDTASVNNAIGALNAAGRGVLYFPAGNYLVSGALTTLSVPCLVLGDGMGAWDNAPYVSKISCSSQSAVLFTVSALYAKFADIALANTYGGTPSSTSAGIQVASSTSTQRVDYESISVTGFYINIDVQVGTGWTMNNCWIYAPVEYGLKIRNTANVDAGDWSISDCGFFSAIYNAQAAIHWESSGGGKITNTKFNMGLDSHKFVNGIEVSVQGTTSDLFVSNSSFENLSGDGIHGTNASGQTLANLIFTGLEFQSCAGSAVNLNATASGDFSNVVIAGCVLQSSGTNAITITNVAHVRITNNANTNPGFTNLLSQTTCTDVVSI